MYNNTKPYNELPLLSPRVNLETLQVFKLADQAGVELARLNDQIADSKLMFVSALLLIEHFSVFEAVDSSKVENIVTTSGEVFEARALPETERTEAQKETLRYTDALILGGDLLRKQGYINTNSLIEIQKKLEPAKPGIRKLPGTQIKNEGTGEIFYTPPEGEARIRDLLKNYDGYYNDTSDDVNALVKMAILHYQFEAIHPFRDGNGRTGRILLPLYLMKQKRMRYPLLFLSEYILHTRSEYYSRLRRVTSNGEWEEWVLYMLEGVRVQSKRTREYLKAITDLAEDIEVEMGKNLPKLASKKLIEYLLMTPVFVRQDYADDFKVTLNTATSHLKQMVDAGFILSTAHKNNKLYSNPRLLVLMDKFHSGT